MGEWNCIFSFDQDDLKNYSHIQLLKNFSQYDKGKDDERDELISQN